jgi:hypothetical protein
MSDLPGMSSNNSYQQIARELAELRQMVLQLRSASGTLGSATVAKGVMRFVEGGSISLQDGGSIVLEDGGGVMVGDGGFITAVGPIRAIDADTGTTVAYFGELQAPYRSGLMTSTPAGIPFFWAAELLNGDRTMAFNGASFRIDATNGLFTSTTHRVDATQKIILNTPSLELYGIATTSSAANVRLEVSGGANVLQYVSSSLRYKDDPHDAVVEPREVLQMQGRTWVDKGLVDRLGDTGDEVDIPRNVGFIAEELDALPSLRQFVDYDDEGRPDAIQYDRLTVALLELAKAQQAQLDALTARLDALDGGTPDPSADTTQE